MRSSLADSPRHLIYCYGGETLTEALGILQEEVSRRAVQLKQEATHLQALQMPEVDINKTLAARYVPVMLPKLCFHKQSALSGKHSLVGNPALCPVRGHGLKCTSGLTFRLAHGAVPAKGTAALGCT